MLQLISFRELLQAKSKRVQEPPCRPKPQQTSYAERVLPAQPPSDSASRGTQRQGQTQKHRFLPKTKLHSRLWAQAAMPPASASAQGDETMQANVKHRSTGKLLSRLSWPLHCQVQSSALPARISSPFPAGEGSAVLPQITGTWNLWQPFPMHSSLPAAWDRDGLSYICLCSTQLPPGSCG